MFEMSKTDQNINKNEVHPEVLVKVRVGCGANVFFAVGLLLPIMSPQLLPVS